LLGAGCSSDEPSGDGDGTIEPTGEYSFCAPAEGTCPASTAGIDFQAPVSFKTDIYDAFLVNSCGGGIGCHANAASSGLALGEVDAPLDTAVVVADLTTRKSDLAEVANVIAGNWEGSFFMQKLDGCQNHSGFTCNEDADGLFYSACTDKPSPCGDAMPASEGDSSNPNAYPITKAQRDKVRVWIQQGAQNN
jgi:hypothetical protein